MEDLVKVYEKKSEAVRSKLAKRHTASSQDAKESGAIHKVYEGWDPATNSEYTNFIPFDPDDPSALVFAG